jgi:hypothetical protein
MSTQGVLHMSVTHNSGGLSKARWSLLLVAAAIAFAGCGDDDGASTQDSEAGNGETSSSAITSEQVCELLDENEVEALVGKSITGQSLTAEPGEGSPYSSCSWNTGRLIIQVAPGNSIVLAPGQECPSIDVGQEGVECPGSAQFVVGDSRVIVQTIEDVTGAQLLAVAEALEPKFSG